MPKRRFVILDRDGTLIVERNYLSDPERVVLLPGVTRGLRHMRKIGLGLFVITNQSAIGRGMIDVNRLELIHEKMRSLLSDEGVFLDGISYCPHKPDDVCNCRKPNTALLKMASEKHGFCPKDCFVIGDKACDVELGNKVGATTILVRTGYGTEVESSQNVKPDFIVNDLVEAANIIEGIVGK